MWSSAEDGEKSNGTAKPDNSLGGYGRLASLFGDVPSVAIYHRFLRASALSLLHYQAELKDLTLELEKCQQRDRDSPEGTPRRKYDFNSRRLRESANAGAEGNYANDGAQDHGVSDRGFNARDARNDTKQWETIERIREVLDKYCKLLCQLEVSSSFVLFCKFSLRPSSGCSRPCMWSLSQQKKKMSSVIHCFVLHSSASPTEAQLQPFSNISLP
jgi:hypothetical protein